MCLAARTYKLPFCFLLPVKIPSSFEGEFGFIRYTVTAVIDIPFQINKKSAERVTILKMIDWNDPDLQVNGLSILQKSFYSLDNYY